MKRSQISNKELKNTNNVFEKDPISNETNPNQVWNALLDNEGKTTSLETLQSEPKTEVKSQRSSPHGNEFKGYKYLRSEFTALPKYRYLDDNTPIKMVNLAAKNIKKSKYIVAPDGYIPNSKIRHLYPNVWATSPLKSSADLKKETDAKLIDGILSTLLNVDKITDVNKSRRNRRKQTNVKQHYANMLSDHMTINNEVIDNFNYEMERLKSEKSDEIPKRKKVKEAKKVKIQDTKLKSSLKIDDLYMSKDIEESDAALVEDAVDIDLLDKLARQIEEFDSGLGENQRINERILKDRTHRMSESELQKCLTLLTVEFGSRKEMYNNLKKALHRDLTVCKIIENVVNGRKNRLALLNTLTDPQHMFNYLLEFYPDKSNLLDDIFHILNSTDLSKSNHLISLCGAKYALQAFITEFAAVRKFALSVFKKKFHNVVERNVVLDHGLRDVFDEKLVFEIFMSSEDDARRFFQHILACQMKEMEHIMQEMLRIFEFQEKFEVSTITKSVTESFISTQNLSKLSNQVSNVTFVSEVSKKYVATTLPALPVYNEESWKIMMSQYLAQMVSNLNLDPKSTVKESKRSIPEDLNFQDSMNEISFLHNEILKLLKVFLNNDLDSAQKLLDGLVAEDDLAFQATVELIGEKEALQIMKILRLKQAKLIEKILELNGNDSEIKEARVVFRSMASGLPQTLCHNLNKWLEHVESKESTDSVEIILGDTGKDDSSIGGLTSEERANMKLVDEDVPFEFFIQSQGRRNRFSIMEAFGGTITDYTANVKNDVEPPIRSFYERISIRHSIGGIDYHGIDSEVDMTLSSQISTVESIGSSTTDLDHGSTKVQKASKIVKAPKVLIVPSGKIKAFDKRSSIDEEFAEPFFRAPSSVEKVSSMSEEETKLFEHIPKISFKYEEVKTEESYDDMLQNLTIIMTSTNDINKLKETALSIIKMVNTDKSHSKSNEAMYEEIIGKVIDIFHETEETSVASKGSLSDLKKVKESFIKDNKEEAKEGKEMETLVKLKLDEMLTDKLPEIIDSRSEKLRAEERENLTERKSIQPIVKEKKQSVRVTSIKTDSKKEESSTKHYTKVEGSQPDFEEAIRQSYIKQQKIEVFIKLLKTMEESRAVGLQKKLEKKKYTCSLYPPEIEEQLSVLRSLGIPDYQPFQILSSKPEIIMRANEEDRGRCTVVSSRIDDASIKETSYLKKDEKSKETHIIDVGINFLQDPLLRSHSTDIFDWSSISEKSINTDQLSINKYDTKSSVKEPPVWDVVPDFKRKRSIVIRDPITIKPLILDSQILKPEIHEVEDVIMKDEESIKYQLGKSQLFRRSTFKYHKPKDPYYDFRTLYGPNAFFLPYISPALLKRIHTKEETAPAYNNEDPNKDIPMYNHLQKFFGPSEKLKCNMFNATRFIRRHSDVPLNDWIKIGAPGMGSNMISADKTYKSTCSRCRFQHLSKLNFHKYGLSTAHHIQRADMVEYITKANAAHMSEKLKMKMIQIRNARSEGSGQSKSSGSLISSN